MSIDLFIMLVFPLFIIAIARWLNGRIAKYEHACTYVIESKIKPFIDKSAVQEPTDYTRAAFIADVEGGVDLEVIIAKCRKFGVPARPAEIVIRMTGASNTTSAFTCRCTANDYGGTVNNTGCLNASSAVADNLMF